MSTEREFGAARAEQLIAEAVDLTRKQKANLLKFVRKFPEQTFYRNVPADLDEVENDMRIIFPNWVGVWRFAVASFGWGRNTNFYFQTVDNRRDVDGEVFDLSMFGNGLGRDEDDTSRYSLLHSSSKLSLFPIATAEENPGVYLGINLIERDKKIYLYHIEDIYDARFSGEDILTAVTPIFADFSEMLASVRQAQFVEYVPVSEGVTEAVYTLVSAR